MLYWTNMGKISLEVRFINIKEIKFIELDMRNYIAASDF